MTGLKDLFTQYGTDKVASGYTPVYEMLLSARRWSIRMLLEIGIGTMTPGAPSSMVGYARPGYRPGGSLRAWRDWLPKALITGIDPMADCQFQEERIVTVEADSTVRDVRLDPFLNPAHPLYGVIIDDGCHRSESQLKTLANLWPCVAQDGFYVIEDCTELLFADEMPRAVRGIVGAEPVLTVPDSGNLLILYRP